MSNKALTLLGFAAKAGKLAYGMDAAVTALKTKKAQLIVVAADISEKSRKEISYHAGNTPVMITEFSIDTLSHAVGKKCGIISVNDKGFSQSIMKKIKEEIC